MYKATQRHTFDLMFLFVDTSKLATTPPLAYGHVMFTQ